MRKQNTKEYTVKGLTKKHEGKWVAVTSDYKNIVGYSDKLTALKKKVGDADVVYLRPLFSDATYAFICG